VPISTPLAANEGPISEFAAYRLTALRVPFDGERFPIQLSEDDLKNADLVVSLKKAEHHAMMAEQFPKWADRITYWHIDDIQNVFVACRLIHLPRLSLFENPIGPSWQLPPSAANFSWRRQTNAH